MAYLAVSVALPGGRRKDALMKNPVATLAALAVGVAAIAPIAAHAQVVLPNPNIGAYVYDGGRLTNSNLNAIALWQRYRFTDTFDLNAVGFVNRWKDGSVPGSGTTPQNRTITVFRNGKNTGVTFTFAPVPFNPAPTQWVWQSFGSPFIANAGDVVDFVFGDAPTDDDWMYIYYTGGPSLVSGVAGIQVEDLRGYRYTDADGNVIGTDYTNQTTITGWGAVNLDATAVPEPGEWAAMGVLGAGLAGLVLRARRRRA